mgnify:CR=1 FL=1
MKNYREINKEQHQLGSAYRKSSPDTMNAFIALHKAVMKEDEALALKYREMIALGIGIASRCDGCIAAHVAGAVKAGASRAELIATVEEAGNVVSSSRSTEDVTLQYVDTESRIAALKTEQTRLLELMEQAETMSDLLEIESRLTEVRGELERYASQLKVLDNQIDYATVNLSLSEVTEYTPVVEKSRLEKIRDGFVSSVKGVGNLILDFISFVLMNIPYILLFGLILWGLLALVKRHRRKHPKKPKAEPKKED